ncbi:hypothetical protein J6590_004554 [Homalodisca vitripennis]|nr:hypothetical protein J6590_004554 [Homalodisca vitripennis]
MDREIWRQCVGEAKYHLGYQEPRQRPPGRPKLRWRDQIRRDVRKLGRREEEAMDREIWRQCVGEAKYHLGYQEPRQRPPGRPKLRWRDQIRRDVRKLGRREEEAMDREIWRQCVGEAKYHLGYQEPRQNSCTDFDGTRRHRSSQSPTEYAVTAEIRCLSVSQETKQRRNSFIRRSIYSFAIARIPQEVIAQWVAPIIHVQPTN